MKKHTKVLLQNDGSYAKDHCHNKANCFDVLYKKQTGFPNLEIESASNYHEFVCTN